MVRISDPGVANPGDFFLFSATKVLMLLLFPRIPWLYLLCYGFWSHLRLSFPAIVSSLARYRRGKKYDGETSFGIHPGLAESTNWHRVSTHTSTILTAINIEGKVEALCLISLLIQFQFAVAL